MVGFVWAMITFTIFVVADKAYEKYSLQRDLEALRKTYK